MKHFVLITAAVTASTFVTLDSANAAVMYEGQYDATSVTTNGNDHSVWLPNLFSGVSNYWQFETGAGDFSVGAGNATASLGGRIVNNGNADLTFDLDIQYMLRPNNAAGTSVKDFGFDYDQDAAERAAIIDTWSFFDISAATLTGFGDLAGLELSLTAFPTLPQDIPFQLGESANDKNTGLGASGWFTWDISGSAANGFTANPNGNGNRHGDINVNLNVAAVPVPAAGLLMMGAIGAMGALRRRKKKAA